MTPEKRIWILGNVLIGLAALLSLRLVYWQLVRGNELRAGRVNPSVAAAQNSNAISTQSPETQDPLAFLKGKSGPQTLPNQPLPLVQRTVEQLNRIARGAMYDRNGRALAYDSIDGQGNKTRWYTEPSLANVIGYVSGARLGVSGLEASYNDTLLGFNNPEGQVARMLHQPQAGSDLVLTIDSSVQRTAEEALGDRSGAVIAVDGHSGAVLAMVSSPYFDPNRMQEQEYVQGLLGSCQGNSSGCPAPFLNRVTQGLYPPGSTFKTVTLIADLDSGKISPDFVFDFGTPLQGPKGPYYVYRVGGGVVPDPNHREAHLDLSMAYARSANAAFARMGDEMGGDTLIEYAQRLGFSSPNVTHFPVEIDYNPPLLARNVDDLRENNMLRAVTAIGQGEVLANPLAMSRVVLAVLNDGRIPNPYLVESTGDPSGLQLPGPEKGYVVQGMMSATTARTVKQMMVTVVENGSGGRATIPRTTVGGKTGTAQVGGTAAAHAWFMGFAEKEKRSVVVVVLVENGGEGSLTAAPIFARVAAAALNDLGKPVSEIIPDLPAPTK